MKGRLVLLGLLAAITVALAGGATAGAPGRWDAVVSGTAAPSVSSELGLARTADGVLHVAWRENTSVRTRTISPAGRLGAVAVVVSGWGLAADPTLLPAGTSLRAFFSAGTPVEGLLTATAPQAGRPWSSPGLVVNAELVRARTIGATSAADGTSLQTWYTGGAIAVHRGLSPTRVYTFGATGTNTRPNIATDTRTGAVLVAWCAFGSGGGGVFVRRVEPATGAPVGGATKLPGSTTTYQGTANATCVLESEVSRREPLAARAGGGFYIAGTAGYPTLNRVLVWRLDGTGRPVSTLVAASARTVSHRDPAIAAAPDGRIWVAWLQQGSSGLQIVARRSNRAGTAFGAPVTARKPPGGISTGSVNLSAQRDRVDVLAVLAAAGSGAKSVRHTQLYPGLTLVRRGVAHRPRGAAVTFAVLDAGEPVAGARVKAGPRAGTTNGAGRVTLLVPRGTVRATASKARYVSARLRFRVR